MNNQQIFLFILYWILMGLQIYISIRMENAYKKLKREEAKK